MQFLYTFSNFCILSWPRCARTPYCKRFFLQILSPNNYIGKVDKRWFIRYNGFGARYNNVPGGGGIWEPPSPALNRVKDLHSNMSFWLFLKSEMSLPSYGVQFFFFDFYGYMSFLYRVNLNLKPNPRQISIEPALSHQIALYSMPWCQYLFVLT